MEYKINKSVICAVIPIKYLDSNILILVTDTKKFDFISFGRILFILAKSISPSFIKKNVINSIDNKPIPILPNSDII